MAKFRERCREQMIRNSTHNALGMNEATNLKQIPVDICKGAVIGVGAILPGVSGGVLCVAFGIYEPMMNFLSHPIRAFKSYYRLLLPVLIGWVIGFLGLARVVELLFRTAQASAIWLFIGLITGTIPSLYRNAGKEGRTAGSWATLVLCLAMFLSWMTFLSLHHTIQIEPSVFWWLICGIMWGIGLIVPGLSPSSFLIYLGLYQPMTAGLADLSLDVIIPIMAGVVLSVLLLVRLVTKLFERSHNIVTHALLGVVIASTIAIIPLGASYTGWDVLKYTLCFIGGLICALWMDSFGNKSAFGSC